MAETADSARVAAADDVRALTALINEAYVVEAFFKRGERTDAVEIAELMRRGRFLVLGTGETLRGCVYVEVNGDRGYFGMLSIDPSSQKQGLGKRLIAAAEDLCRSAGCRTMELQVVSLRTELPPYYRKFGYTEAGIREFVQTEEWTKPCHFVVMSKPL
jgi:GNAT superfamily N-acetyltransferase